MLRWSSSGDSFYIINTTEFTKALPHYFKAKSFGSFVRQLNMYHFFKVRGQKQYHEFRHPFFRRDAPEGLKYIRRKHVRKNQKEESVTAPRKSSNINMQILNMKLSKMEEILQLMMRQNTDLSNINNQMSEELCHARADMQLKTHELFDLMAMAAENPDALIITKCREFMRSTDSPLRDVMPTELQALLYKCKEQGTNLPYDMNILFIIESLSNIYANCRSNARCDLNELTLDSLPAQNNDCASSYMTIYSPRDNFNPQAEEEVPVHTCYSSPFGLRSSGYNYEMTSPVHEQLNHTQYMTLDDMKYEVFINNSCDTAAREEEAREFGLKPNCLS